MTRIHHRAVPGGDDDTEFITVDTHRFYLGDCVRGMRKHLADSSVDLIVTDPPFGIDGDLLDRHYNRDGSLPLEGYCEVSAADYPGFCREWITEAARVLRPLGGIYIVSGWTHLVHVLNALAVSGLREVNHIVWKYNFGVYTSRKYVASHYHILFWEKPGKGHRTFNIESRFPVSERTEDNRSANYRDREDVWIINREYKRGQVKNRNELPMELVRKMLQYSSNPGDLVLDPFLGGFTVPRVAMAMGRVCVGFEVSEPIFRNGIDIITTGVRKCSPVSKQQKSLPGWTDET